MLSVIIPTYNEGKYLPLLLSSLRNQTFKNFEIIVADARSKDRTRTIAEKAGCRVVEGGLPACGRNKGAAAAKGEWLLFLDADVILPVDFLDKAMKEIKRRDLDVASAPIQPLSDKKIDKIFHEAYNVYAKATTMVYPHAPGFCIFAKKKIHRAIGGFDESLKLAEDHDYVARAGRVGKFRILKSVRIPVSVRRFDRDGRTKIAIKYLACEAHRLLLGPVSTDIFNYKFGHTKSRK